MRRSSTTVGALARAAATVKEWRRLSRSRRELAALGDYQLWDLGLSRSSALFESGKKLLSR
jgi:uncharacterized protein YjiS (DUF1127 family)